MIGARDRQTQDRIAAILDRVERPGRRASFDEIRELAHLYRLSSARLAILRSRGADPEAVRYLNALCVRAFTHMRVSPPRPRRLGRFLGADFPATLAATARLQMLIAALLLAGAIIGAATVTRNPAALYVCIPGWMYPADELQQLSSSRAVRMEFLNHQSMTLGIKSIFSAGLFIHNTEVGLLAFATGILAGVPTLVLVFYNGLSLGAFASMFSHDDTWWRFWAWLLPHAIPELLATILCACGGLLLGNAVIAPGRQGTAAALRRAARPALQMVAAAIPLLVLAAAIESFLRQSSLPAAARFATAGASLAAIAAYVAYVLRFARRRPEVDLGWLLKEGPPAAPPDSGSAPAH
ncbi:MAG TPA: stage II sporulation protein M [Candidatus Binataceae bacterium]|nr:stage II sporulation protein M [Candidatus Binataceae bacterium]